VIISISSDAEDDLIDGYWFYERQHPGLGDYFRSCLIADIESLAFYAGIHEVVFGSHRLLSKRFPFCIYYVLSGNSVLVVAVLDARRNPLWTRQRLGME
jgi:plasmid stabilization system protein ParE